MLIYDAFDLYKPSHISNIIPLFHMFHKINSSVEQQATKLLLYSSDIETMYFLSETHRLPTEKLGKIKAFKNILCHCSKDIETNEDFFLKAYSKIKEENEIYLSRLSLLELGVFETMIKALICKISFIEVCIKYLTEVDVLREKKCLVFESSAYQ